MYSLSLSSDGRDDPASFNAKARFGESGGAARIWLANHLFQRDPITLGAIALQSTQRLQIALMAISPFTVHPVQAAMAAATLEEFFPGRVSLCFGTGAPLDLSSIGLDGVKPLRPIREAIDIARTLLDGETVRYEGQSFRVRGRSLVNGARAVPIILAASGPHMLEIAGATADGVLISAGTSVEFVRWCLEHVRHGAAGRKIRVCGLVYAAIADRQPEADARLRRILAITLRGQHHTRNLEITGTALDQAKLRQASEREDWTAAEAQITEAVLRHHSASGTAADVRARFSEYHAAGLDEIVISGARDGAQVAALLNAANVAEQRGAS